MIRMGRFTLTRVIDKVDRIFTVYDGSTCVGLWYRNRNLFFHHKNGIMSGTKVTVDGWFDLAEFLTANA